MKELLITFTVAVPVRVADDLKHCDSSCSHLDGDEAPAICRLLTPGNTKEWYQNPVWDAKARAYRCTKRCRKLTGR